MNIRKLLDLIIFSFSMIGGVLLLIVGPEYWVNYKDFFLLLVLIVWLLIGVRELYLKIKEND